MKVLINFKKYFFKEIVFFLFISFNPFQSIAQEVYEEERYVPETNPLILEKLEQWKKLKFGLLMHWGAYSQWGIVESWSLCPEEYDWCKRTEGSNPDDYVTYKKEYENLKKTFNPVNFNPEKWANAAKYAGMKYMIFTTKHHDGFTMFDSKFTDYKVTASDCLFSINPRSNITKEIFKAFREKDFWTGAYFSKPDWHHPSYWDPKYPPKDRNVNYEPEANPEKWQNFVDFTHNQILELLTEYGKVDILWLDGGWVSRVSTSSIDSWYAKQLENSKSGYLKHRIVNQDIKMDDLVKKAREKQPDLLIVDRAVHGVNQNYLTPENRVPEKALNYPWESCIISGGGWAHTKDATYMSGHQGIQLLVDIVSKGGNLLLNVAPTPEGEWQQGAYALLNEFGEWMKINAEAIYNTETIAPYKENNVCMTKKDDGTTYFMYMALKDEIFLPKMVTINSHRPINKAEVTLLGSKNKLKWEVIGDEGFKISIPDILRKKPPSKYVWVFKVSEIK